MSLHTTALRRLQEQVGELIATHDRGSLDHFGQWEDDPVGFIRDVLKARDPGPWSGQEEIAEAVRDHPLVTVRSCNGAGKDWLSAHLALWWVYARRGLVLATGPTERQVREIVMGEVSRAFNRARSLPGDLYQMALRVGGDENMGILAFTSTDPSKLTGFHAPRLLVLITEAQGVEPFAWEAALACATGTQSRILAVGNPLAPTGRFFETHRSSSWHVIPISAFDHPNLKEGREVIPGAVTKEGVARIATEFGEGSGVYRARVLGEFPDEAEDSLVHRSWLERSAADLAAAKFSGEMQHSGFTFALDPARFGPDQSVLAVARGPVITRITGWRGLDTMATVGRLLKEVADSGALFAPRTEIVVDEVGIGSGVVDRLREAYRRLKVHAFNGGRAAQKPSRFFNARAEVYWTLRKLLEEGKVGIPRDDRLWDELTATRWKPSSTGTIQIEAKDALRSRLGRSPDRADAVSMAFLRYARPRVPRLEPLYW